MRKLTLAQTKDDDVDIILHPEAAERSSRKSAKAQLRTNLEEAAKVDVSESMAAHEGKSYAHETVILS